MDSDLIFMSIFFGIVLGLGGAFLLILIKKKRFKKKILERIRKQDAKLGEDRTPTNFYKGNKKFKPKEEIKKVEKKKPKKKVRYKRMKSLGISTRAENLEKRIGKMKKGKGKK